MKRIPFAVVALLLLPLAVGAQDWPKGEMFGGYGFERFEGLNGHGWNAAVMANFNRWFGLGADIGGEYGGKTELGFRVDYNIHSFLFGPQFSARSEKVTAFCHFLAGGSRFSAGVDLGSSAPGVSANETGFAFMVGGGIDASIGKTLAVRLVQADYHSAWAEGGRGDGVRVAAGLVVKF
jgi:hypothetical protein